MRIGFAVPQSGAWATPDNLRRVAVRAEELGYHDLWTFQRLLYPVGHEMGPTYRSVHDPVVTLAHLSGVTGRVGLAVAVLNAYAQPVVLAKQLATLQTLSGGRLTAGIGLGWLPEEFTAAGVAFEGRGRRGEEFVEVLRKVWNDDPVEHEGAFYRVPASHVDPKPAPGPPPILLGGTAEVALRRAQADQVRVVGEAAGRPARWEERPPEEGRHRLVAAGLPAEVADGILRARAELVDSPWPVTPRPGARPFRAWAAEHAHRFRTTMRAARLHSYGDPSVIRHDELPIPAPGPGEVLIKVAGTSFNPSEVGLRSGLLAAAVPEWAGLRLPYTLGWDVAGTVVETGPGLAWPRVGDEVIGRLDGGAAASYALAPARVLARAPHGVPLADAAAIPVAGLTAWQAVHEHARIGPGQRVLVNGAGGGVGGFAVQLAKLAGAFVIATAGSARSAARARAHRADEVVDYRTDPLPGGLDVLLNLVPLDPDAGAGLTRLVRPGGVLVSATAPVEASPGVTSIRFVARNDAAHLAVVAALAEEGGLAVDVAERLPLTELAAVHHRAESGDANGGKIILLP
ncbi:LLM class flavin-dependent oxidoreductase [Nonomuraea wenchangensis]|uniref:LLM class flavin-dependent oxidoreductase n=1 Tax=Nonomuraea wenchangensis TaxID=568860 RepID=UPI00331B10F9